MNQSIEVKFFIVCGEASGDFIASKLIHQLKKLYPKASFLGVGGPRCIEEGLVTIFDYAELSIMGFWDVLPKVFKIQRLIKLSVEEAINFQPHMIITVDSFGFNKRFISKLREKNINSKIVHYVAPTVWAYDEYRARQVAKLYDHIFCILPFEPVYFEKAGISATFVGHPFLEKEIPMSEPVKGRKNIILMPGSRVQEIRDMGVIMHDAAIDFISRYDKNVTFFIPTFDHLSQQTMDIFKGPCFQVISNYQLNDVIKTSNAAIVKSGTSAVEMMFAKLPCVIIYKTSWLNYFVIKSKIKIKFINITNILLNKPLLPELLQRDCNPRGISDALYNILSADARNEIEIGFDEALKMLKPQDDTSSKMVSDKICEMLKLSI